MTTPVRPPAAVQTDASNAALTRATLANLASLNRNLRHAPDSESEERDGLFRWRTPIPNAFYNGVVCAAAPAESAAARVAEIDAYFRVRNEAYRWWFDPDAPVEAWAPHLLAQGLRRCAPIPGMAIELDRIAGTHAAGVEVRRVDHPDARRTWARTFCLGFGYPDSFVAPVADTFGGMDLGGDALHSFLAYLDGRPVATASWFEGDGVAGLYDVATIPEGRGRGVGGTLTTALFEDAGASGYKIGILHASDMGAPLYQRLGFRTVCNVESFEWKAEPC